MNRPTCKTCPYFFAYGDYVDGECRRHAPKAQNIDNREDDHAVIGSDHWCGEHPDFPAYILSLRSPAPPPPGLNVIDTEVS